MAAGNVTRTELLDGRVTLVHGDCLEVMRSMPSDSVDLIVGSPPYEAARTYSIGFAIKGQAWVDWMVERWREMQRISRGVVAMVVEGQTRQFQWSATPALLMADLHRAGFKLRKPPAFVRVGIPGSGGPDWLRNDYEFIVCTSKGKLPWSENTACGKGCAYPVGGAMSNRTEDGRRRNHETRCYQMAEKCSAIQRVRSGEMVAEPKVAAALANGIPPGAKLHTKNNGDSMRTRLYIPPTKANPGNIIKAIVGGGVMGSKLSHENEAPFPEALVRQIVLPFCPIGGIVLDPFGGSGTTLAVAIKNGRRAIAIDVRESQIELMKRRVAEAAGEQPLLAGTT
jgi:hypothetical protein